MFIYGIPVGHPGNVIAYGSLQTAPRNPLLNMIGQDERFSQVGIEKVCDDVFCFHLHAYHAVMAVEFIEQEVLQFAVAALHFFAKTDKVV